MNDKFIWMINDFDDRGLMYGLLDVAERKDGVVDRLIKVQPVCWNGKTKQICILFGKNYAGNS